MCVCVCVCICVRVCMSVCVLHQFYTYRSIHSELAQWNKSYTKHVNNSSSYPSVSASIAGERFPRYIHTVSRRSVIRRGGKRHIQKKCLTKHVRHDREHCLHDYAPVRMDMAYPPRSLPRTLTR